MSLIVNNNYYFHSKYEGEIFKQLSLILKNQKKMADELATLTTLVADLQTSLDTKQAAIAEAIAAFEKTIADLTAQSSTGGATAAQLQTVIDSLTASKADLESTPLA